MFFGGFFSVSSYSIWALCYVNTAKIRKPSNQTILKTFPKVCFKRTKFVTVLNHAMDINEHPHGSMYCMWMHCVLVSSSASDQGVEMEIPCSDRRSPALHWLCNPPLWNAILTFIRQLQISLIQFWISLIQFWISLIHFLISLIHFKISRIKGN